MLNQKKYIGLVVLLFGVLFSGTSYLEKSEAETDEFRDQKTERKTDADDQEKKTLEEEIGLGEWEKLGFQVELSKEQNIQEREQIKKLKNDIKEKKSELKKAEKQLKEHQEDIFEAIYEKKVKEFKKELEEKSKELDEIKKRQKERKEEAKKRKTEFKAKPKIEREGIKAKEYEEGLVRDKRHLQEIENRLEDQNLSENEQHELEREKNHFKAKIELGDEMVKEQKVKNMLRKAQESAKGLKKKPYQLDLIKDRLKSQKNALALKRERVMSAALYRVGRAENLIYRAKNFIKEAENSISLAKKDDTIDLKKAKDDLKDAKDELKEAKATLKKVLAGWKDAQAMLKQREANIKAWMSQNEERILEGVPTSYLSVQIVRDAYINRPVPVISGN